MNVMNHKTVLKYVVYILSVGQHVESMYVYALSGSMLDNCIPTRPGQGYEFNKSWRGIIWPKKRPNKRRYVRGCGSDGGVVTDDF